MPDAYEIFHGRFISKLEASSTLAGLLATSAAVPPNRVWTILSAILVVDADETRDFWFSVGSFAGYFGVTIPQSFAIVGAANKWYPMLREGMELKLFPGETLCGHRAAATAGSTMVLHARYIESDLPIYEEYEPQVRRAQVKRRSSGQRISSGGGSGSAGGSGIESGGGEGGAPPVPPVV